MSNPRKAFEEALSRTATTRLMNAAKAFETKWFGAKQEMEIIRAEDEDPEGVPAGPNSQRLYERYAKAEDEMVEWMNRALVVMSNMLAELDREKHALSYEGYVALSHEARHSLDQLANQLKRWGQ